MRIKIFYASILLFLSTIGFTSFLEAKPIIEYKRIAGIEVGAKGVKMTILERSLQNDNDIKVLKDSSVNTDFISFNANSYDATLNALTGLYNYAVTFWNVLPSDIATVISSGVKAQMEKQKKEVHIKTFIDAFRIKINEENKVVEVVDVLKESVLSHYGIINDANRYNTFLIDIGSGNTKGGYFVAGSSNFVMFQIPSGTKSTTNLTDKKCGTPCDFSAFNSRVQPVIDSLEKSEIIFAVNASGAFPRSNTMALSGGIAWAVATLLYPENPATSIDITYKDLVRFRENLVRYEKEIPDTNRIEVKDFSPEKLHKIRMEVNRVLNVFDTKSLLAGSGLMLKIMRQFEPSSSTKKFKLIKNGQVGWITGYILNLGGYGKK